MHPLSLSEDQTADASLGRQAASYLYAAYWMYKFYFRREIIGRMAPYALTVLFGIELLGPITHALPIAETGPSRYVVAGLLLLTASVIIWHHTRLKKRVERHTVLLSSTMVLLEEQTLKRAKLVKHVGEMRRKKIISNILDAFVFALEENYPSHSMAASVVVRDTSDGPFRIYVQDPRDLFDGAIELHPVHSVAGLAALEGPGALLYVPRTDHVHAIRIAPEQSQDQTKTERFRTARIVPNAFQSHPKDPKDLKSLLCVRVPLEPDESGKCAILSFSRGKRDGMTDLEFNAIKVAAALVSLAFVG